VNVVDIFSRRGYRFSGTATVHEQGDDVYNRGLELLRERDYTLRGVATGCNHGAP
jgi:hypothetical protein